MAARAYWSGYLRVSLVSFAVRLYPGSNPARQVAFHQIDKKSGERVRQQLIVPDKGPVDKADIVKGYEYEKGHYIEIDPEDLAALRLPAARTIDIVQFVGLDEIDPIYYDRPYYLVPEDEMALPAFATIREALKRSRAAGLGEVVFAGKEHLAAIRACGKGMVLDTLRYQDEIKRAAPYFDEIGTVEIDPDQLDLAEKLIRQKTAPLDMSKFSDSYEAAVKELVAAKLEHRPPPRETEAAPRGNVVNLMDALRKSLTGGAEPAKPARKPPEKGAAAKAKKPGATATKTASAPRARPQGAAKRA
jgi:DNA end-binding protein Ku